MNILRRFFHRTPQTLSSITAYELWAQSYPAEAHNILMQIEQENMLAIMPSLEDKVVLDLACGTGRYGKIAQNQKARQVIGVDNSFAMLERRAIPQGSQATSEAIPLPDESIDVVLCGLALGHLPEIRPSLSEISRILRPEGIALISDFHPYQFLSGARRTFQAGNKNYAVEHYVHHISDYFSEGQLVNLHITDLREPLFQEKSPVVLVVRYEKDTED